jgi:hypothetical protein
MEELRIKCPSCGIILEVRNSKNEAIKRITCPNCKKQLAVTFHEEPQPAQYVEIKMVQLADDSQKTIVRALTDDHIVKVNGERLLKDDEVVLGPDDQLEIDGKPQFGPKTKPVSAPTSATVSKPVPAPKPKPEPKAEPKELAPTSEPKRNNWFLSIAIVAVIVAAFILWQKFSDSKSEAVSTPSADTIVAPRQETGKKDLNASKPKMDVRKEDPKAAEQQPAKPAISSMNEYDLERMAIKGDAEAQCQLGKRWVNKGDSTNVVKGIKYLKQAAHNGSSEAKTALNKVYATLQQSAAHGSTTASNILREQR